MNEQFASDTGSQELSQLDQELSGIIRTGRSLKMYKHFLGDDLGKEEGLILDVGSGDSLMADQIAQLTDHHARVIRVDAGYVQTLPRGISPAIAADATALPIASNSVKKVVSLWMLPHLGPEKGRGVMSELLRVVEPGGEILLSPGRPLKKINHDFSKRYRSSTNKFGLPAVIITKPADFDEWSPERKVEVYEDLTHYVTYGGVVFKMMKWGYARSIGKAGTNRTVEQGRENSLSPFRKKL